MSTFISTSGSDCRVLAPCSLSILSCTILEDLEPIFCILLPLSSLKQKNEFQSILEYGSPFVLQDRKYPLSVLLPHAGDPRWARLEAMPEPLLGWTSCLESPSESQESIRETLVKGDLGKSCLNQQGGLKALKISKPHLYNTFRQNLTRDLQNRDGQRWARKQLV